MRASVSDRTTHGDDIDLITRLRASASDWAVKCATACNERDEAQDERDAARKQLAATQAIARMLQATAHEILAAYESGTVVSGELLGIWRERLGGDHA
jgi:hypothetical protein